jgi:GNAT superfamily N-acetyltransferase
MKQDVVTTYLEMNSPADLRACDRPCCEMQILLSDPPDGELNRLLYIEVGRKWSWTDRLVWTPEQWQTYGASPTIETWVGYVNGSRAGYFELAGQFGKEKAISAAVEIAYFGLMPGYIGQGLGGRLLEAAIRRAWDLGPTRVWVHTCTLDGPYAQANYEARGMKTYRVEQ